MTDDTNADPADQGDEGADDADEQPDIEDEEMADFSTVANEIEEEAGAAADEDEADEESDEQDAESADSTEEPDMDLSAPSEADISIGDVYCNGLGMMAAVGRSRYGSAERDRSALVDEYGDLARDLQIDEYVDQWMAEHGGMDELGPGQAIVVSTLLFGGMVAMDDPEMVENVAGGVSA